MGKRKSYAEEEMNLSDQSKAFVDYLTSRGVLSDQKISDKNIREKKKELAKKAYHNTLLLLKHYRDIIWAMNSIPSELKQELNIPLSDLDGLLDRLDTEMSLENVEMENRLRTIMKSRLLIDRLNEAVSVLKDKPTDGDHSSGFHRTGRAENSCMPIESGIRGQTHDFAFALTEDHAFNFIRCTNLWETLRYTVSEIQIIEPYEVEKIHIQEGRDLVTLLSCHPPGSGGKQRYLVICERTENESDTEIPTGQVSP